VGNAGAAGTRGEKAARTRIKALGESAIIPSSPASVMMQTCTPNCKAADRHNNVTRTETCECDGLPPLRSARAPIKQAQRDNRRRIGRTLTTTLTEQGDVPARQCPKQPEPARPKRTHSPRNDASNSSHEVVAPCNSEDLFQNTYTKSKGRSSTSCEQP
jgi:hypothetical protein